MKNVDCAAKRESFLLDESVAKGIQDFCTHNRISNFNFLMSIYSAYLSRVSGKEDFVIGTPILNRTNAKEKQTMGMFVNTIPVRVSIPNNDTSFEEFIHTSATKMIGFIKHQKYSYTQILEDLRSENSKVSNLYNVLISYQITKAVNKEFGDYETEWIFNGCCASDFNIHITDINDTGKLLVSYDYLIDKYDSIYVKKLHERIIYMIKQVTQNPQIQLKDIEIVTIDEKNKLLSSFNNVNVNYPRNKTVVDLFEEQVKNTPDNIAVVYEDKKLTYKELNEKANSLANYLTKTGVKEKDIIGIRINKSLEMIIGIIAIIKSGCCYLPINMQYPRDRVEYMLEDSKAKLLLGTKESLSELNLEIEGLDISLSETKIYKNDNKNLNLNISPEDLIYIIYTSGSTGKPKGAMLCHRNVVRLMKNDKFLFDFNDKDIWTMFHSVAFDFSVWEMYGALLYGGKLVIVPEYTAKDPNLFLDLLNKEHVTVLNQTPTYFYNLLNCEVKNKHDNLKIRYIIFGGEALKPNMLLPWRKIHPKTKLINMYGITETTVHVTFKELKDEDLESAKSNIGMPIPTLGIILLDNNLKLVPPGTPGEICVCGDGIFKGYLNREDLNKIKLVQNPYNRNEIIYRSADSGVVGDDYSLEYIGRIDKQVKIRGFRVELGEIEEKILAFKEINSCIVTTKRGTSNHDLLCAYYIANTSINLDEMKSKLRADLPNYMIPQYFIEVEKWPLNHNGKIDVKELPEPQYQTLKEEIVLPRNETDSKLIELLKEVLNVETISLDNNFFDLGGDSLSAIILCTQIQDKFKVQLYVKDIIDNPIVKDISDMISDSKNFSKEQTINKVSEADFYNVSSAQKRIYFATQMAGNDSIIYNVPGGVILDGNIDSQKLEECLIELINRHESLRTYFELDNEKVVQKISEKIEFKLDILEEVDFNDIRTIYNHFVKPFDLGKAPLFRAEFIEFTNNKSAIFIDMHHIISDGTSMSIFIEELCKLYNGESLPKLNLTYKDFTEFENKRFLSGDLDEAEKYWVSQFKDEIPVLNMPTSYSRPAVRKFEGKKTYKTIDSKITNKIKSMSKEMGITPYMFLLAGYYIMLSKYTAQDDIVIGSPIVGREYEELYNVIGMFVNTLPLRNKIDSQMTFREFVHKVKENVLNSYKYQAYPFDELVNKLEIRRDTSRNPLFDTMLIYQNNGLEKLEFKNVKAEYYIPDSHISKFDLSVEAIPNANGEIELSFEYDTSLFDEEFIQNLANHYLNILTNTLENNNVKITDINMLSKEEKNKILYEFNNTAVKYQKEKTISDLFEEQVEKTPDNVAVVFGEREISYKELNAKANNLAYYLRNNLNISRNDLVGIMVNRSIEMIVAILAVLKAGGAYIPIDPSFPKDRIKYMLDSSKAKILLTQRHLNNDINFENKICIDLDNKDIYGSETNNLEHINMPDDLSYVIFTSGSTGLPKGVMLKHKALSNLTNYCNNYIEYLKNPLYQAVVSITTVSFDIFIFETLISLQKGLKLIIANENEQTTPQLLNKLIEQHDIKIIQSTPSRMQIFINNIADMPSLKNLEYITLAGERLPLTLVNKLHEISNSTIYNGYGPSETTVFSTLTKMGDSIITIGRPLDNTQIYILNDNLQPVPIGVSGEIYISGDGVGKGYLNNNDLTKKSFIPNPYISDTLMYKTGDIGKYTNDGEIICLGRSDNQIKIRGLRIEPEEIESVILKYPNIKKVSVIKQTVGNREFISAYYVANKRVIINELRKYISRYLPRYMVPSYYIALSDMPYTPNGKIDKKALPLPTEILNISKEEYTAPKTKLQKQLVDIWEKVLNTKPVGINDNFFELGGDSLLAMNLNIELLKITDKITYQDIFRYPTILELEEKIDSNENKPLFSKIENLSDNFSEVLKNTTKNRKIKRWHPRNILLTGATGFLGIHILDEFIRNEKGNIYCIIKEEPGITSRTKLYQKLNYYFGNKYDELIDNRIFAITGDITESGFGLNQEQLLGLANSIDVVINSAAKVSHYGNYNDFYNSNVKSVKYIIDFCKSFNKKLYQISTMSVSGRKLDMSYPANSKKTNIIFDETSLYVGQTLENVYVRSKFEAECYVLDAISSGLDGYILRMGNLMPRLRDGVFQENLADNAFISKIISFTKMGILPDYMLSEQLEFTPVDSAAKAIYKLIIHPNQYNRVFHLYNPNYIPIEKMQKIAKKLDYDVAVLPEEKFKNILKIILDSEDSNQILNNLVNDLNNNLHLDYKIDIIIKSEFTAKYLRRTFYKWPRIYNNYLIRLINLIRKET